MEFLMENTEWLEEALGEDEDDYVLFDCPGQIELYTHMNVMRKLVDQLQSWNFRVCGVFVLDSHFMVDGGKFISEPWPPSAAWSTWRSRQSTSCPRWTSCRPTAGSSWTPSSVRTRRS